MPDASIITQDIPCPNCEYNLRGLQGDVVSCPECGMTCDRAEIVARRWTLPWYKAPGMSLLNLPVAWLYLGLIAMVLWFNNVGYVSQTQRLLAWSALIIGWMLLMARAWFVFERSEALLLALLGHVVLAAYLLAFIMIPIMWLSLAFVEQARTETLLGIRLPITAWLLILPVVAIVLFLAARRGERFVAHRCIRQYLRRKPRS